MNRVRPFVLLAAAVALLPAQDAKLPPVRPETLKAHVAFLASDRLEGRDTPSRGLDIAAEYIAAQFTRLGLEPPGDDGYFQTANLSTKGQDAKRFSLTFEADGRRVTVKASQVSGLTNSSLSLKSVPLVKLATDSDPESGSLDGKVALIELPVLNESTFGRFTAWREKLAAAKPALVLWLDRKSSAGSGFGARRLERPARGPALEQLTVHSPDAAAFFDSFPATGATASVRTPPPDEGSSAVRNVAAILRGADPALRSTYLIVSAHYDHVGMLPPGSGDRVFNGANDDASGVASVLALAEALAALPESERPKRSILFLAFFGEEKGLLGAAHYARSPLVPLNQTVAMLNLEQLGRTDDSEGPQVSRLAVTGFDFSDLTSRMQAIAKETGVEIFGNSKLSDAYFNRADNAPLARAGVPAHTASVAYSFPDYHKVGDEAAKLDYANQARVTNALALILKRLGDDPQPVKWNENNSKAKPYREVREKSLANSQ